jgi:hypothetical protein
MPIAFISSLPGGASGSVDLARQEIAQDDVMDWSRMAPVGDHGVWDEDVAGVKVTTLNNNVLVLSSPGPGHHCVRQQGGPLSTWQGNFSDREAILCTDHSTSKLAVNFRKEYVRAVGTQIAPKGIIGEYHVTLKVYWSSSASSLEPMKTDFLGIATTDGDGSALFVGAKSTAKNISRIELAVYNRDWKAVVLGINRLLIHTV